MLDFPKEGSNNVAIGEDENLVRWIGSTFNYFGHYFRLIYTVLVLKSRYHTIFSSLISPIH